MNTMIGARIRELREARKIKQEELANFLGYSRQRLARMENGESDISYDAICKVSDFLGINTAEITKVATKKESLTMMFRQEGNEIDEQCEKLFEMLDLVYAHKKIYNKTRGEM